MALPVDDSPATPQVRRLSSPSLIGRARPLNTLLTLWAQVRAGAGALAVIEAEAGVGKTRLLREFSTRELQADHSGTLLAGHCFEPDQSVPYAPIADLLRTLYASLNTAARLALFGRYAGDLAPLLPELADRMPGSQGRTAESTTDQRRLWHSLTQLLTQHAQARPLVILIEDVHWADPASLTFIQYLARRVPAHPWLLLLSLRPNPMAPALTQLLADLERDHTAIDIELAPLSAAATRQMVQALLAPAKPPAQLVETVYRLSEGNPFFVEELVQAWMNSANRQAPGASWDAMALRLPRTLRATVQQRLSELDVEAGRVLRLAAVIGRRFDFPLLLLLTGLGEFGLLAHLRALVQAQLVAEESVDVFVFRHALTREAVYRDLLERERLTLHRTILGGLESLHPEPNWDRVMADLALHAYQSGSWAKAMNYAQAAGRQAQALHAPQTAVEHFTYAILSAQRLDLVPPPALYRARGQMHELLGQFEPACSDYELALATARQLRDAVAECQGLLDLGFLWTGRDYARAGGYFDEAVALARPLGQPALLATTLNRVGLSHTHAERPLVGLRHHAEALAVYRAEADLAGQAETLDLLGVTAFMAGDLALGWRFFEEGITLCRRTGDRQRLATLLFTGAMRGGGLLVDTLAWLPVPSEACLRECAEAIQIIQAIPWPAGEAYAHIIYAHLLGERGQMGAALAAAQTALQLADSIEHAMWTLNAHVALGALYLELLRPDLALPYLLNAPAEAQALGSTYMTYLAASYLSRCYLAQKQAAQVAEALEGVLTPTLPCQTLAQRLVWAAETERLLATRQWAEALTAVDRLIAATRSDAAARVVGWAGEMPTITGPRLYALRAEAFGGLGRVADAIEACQTAAHTAEKFGALPTLWRAQSTLAGLQRAAGDRAAAVDSREAALATIDAVAASLDEADPVRERFRVGAIASLPAVRLLSARALARRQFDGLTPRQVDIARRVAQGQPNRTIAVALTLSERTVEKHIENILAKLGFKTRAQIAAWAAKKRLIGGSS